MFKDVVKGIVGEDTFYNNRRVCWSIASGSAEFIADLMLCPLEGTKVRV